MKVNTLQFKAKETHRVCVNLKPLHFEYLKKLAICKYNGNISQTILYLLTKYLKYLYRIKIIDVKRTMTIDYQPSTKEYKRYWININPTYWGNLYNLKFSLGYSMSYLLRIMLDWEMEENNEPEIDVLIPKPILNEQVRIPISNFTLHNYAQKVWIYHISRWVFLCSTGYD